MSVTIGHASLAETGTVNGKKGDQTGREVCTRSWYQYRGGWGFVLRPPVDVAEQSAVACEKGVKNDRIGYSQDTRNSLHTEAKRAGYDLSRITTPCNCDCSSFMTVCAIAGGAPLEYTGNAPTTSTMRNAFSRAGYEVLTDRKYLVSPDYLQRGDILVAPGHHTVMVLNDGDKVERLTLAKTVEEIAEEVWLGQWGSGKERERRITAAGYDYQQVRAAVNSDRCKPAAHIDQKGMELLKRFEGCRLTAYRLKNETYYTIGYGHNGPDVVEGMTISQEKADEIFRVDLARFERYVKTYVTDIVLTQNRLNALVSYCYNRGPGRLKDELAYNCHTVQQYADGIVKYWGSNQAYKDALIKRRKAERDMFLSV